jgi:hypothetical protein
MSAMRSCIEAAGGGLAGPLVEGKGIKRGLDAISQQTVGSEDIFMAELPMGPDGKMRNA